MLPVYTGSNAVAEFDILRSLVFGIVPMPGLFFIAAIVIYSAVLRFTPFGRYVYAIGGNEEAARLSGIDVGKVKIATYAISGLLAGIAAVLYVAQYRQGKPDAGAGLELDAIAAVVIGGTSLMGGRGGMAGTFCRRADLRPALQHPSAPQHQLEPSARAEGTDHHRHRARAGAQSRPIS